MAYTALYRKFRPLTFDEMVGQEHITKTLKNQIIANRVGHAYLFNGSRGTGKTSAAKILARAINCLNPKDGQPCNECEVCRAALSGSLTDIVEMDAASNNSVEDIRSIREEVNFLPTVAKYRVYIIDEVHMLSTGAFNALLKTLEEPPQHVKFILATTEPQKIPATILSRCQRFDFKRISNENIIKRLEIVCKQSNIQITKGALTIISVLAEGALRDALSILERCLQDGEYNIDEDKVKDLVGIPKLEMIYQLTKGIVEKDVDIALHVIDEIMKEGKDISNVLWEITKYVKDILVYQTTRELLLYNEQETKQIEELSHKITKEKLLQIIYELSELDRDIRWSSQKLILFQAAILRLCTDRNQGGIEDLTKRVLQLEKMIENRSKIAQAKKKEIVYETRDEKQKEEKVGFEKKNIVKEVSNVKTKSFWPDVLSSLKQEGKIMLYTNLMNAKAKKIDDLTIGIEFAGGLTNFGKTVLEKPENMQELIRKVSIACGQEMRIKLVDGVVQTKEASKQNSEIENLAKDFDLPINIIEE